MQLVSAPISSLLAELHQTEACACACALSEVPTCCQYSSSDGRAEKYPVSCTIWSSWKMLHMGMTSISPPEMQPRVEARCSAAGSGACVHEARDARRARRQPTLPKCQRTVNFPPDSKSHTGPAPCDYITSRCAGQWARRSPGPAHRGPSGQSGAGNGSSAAWWLARGPERLRLPLG